MAEVMRSCFLRAGLSQSRSASDYVLGNPKSWLGTAYHEVLEKFAASSDSTIDVVIEQLWDAAIAKQHQRAQAHPLDARFGLPPGWPGYHLARAAVRLRAEEMALAANSMTGLADGPTPAGPSSNEIREREFIAFGGKLRGRPDLIRTDEIVDYKSGAIVEFDETTQTETVKSAYVRQLRIYGYLVHQALGWWPARGLLLPLAGAGVEVLLDPVDCAREATEAVALMDEYNTRLRSGTPLEALAAPSPASCKWCPFKLICPAFWESVTPCWSGQLDGAVLEGVLPEGARRIHGGAALGISLDVVAGSELPRRAEIAPLNPSVHTAATRFASGDRVRLVGVRVRPDGKLVPTLRTILSYVSELPSVQAERDETV